LTSGSGIGKKSGSGFGINNPVRISETLETIFWVKIIKILDADRGWKNSDQGWEKFGTLGAGTICNTLLAATETTTNTLSRKTRHKYLVSFLWI
jgi:hypothetical protein